MNKYIPFPYEEVYFILDEAYGNLDVIKDDDIEALKKAAHNDGVGRVVMKFDIQGPGKPDKIKNIEMWVGYNSQDEFRALQQNTTPQLMYDDGTGWKALSADMISEGPGIGGYGIVRGLSISDPAVGWAP
jgi:hypothetical protein